MNNNYHIKKKQLCLECNYKNYETINGLPKCYWNCPYRLKKNKKGIEKFI